MRRLLTGYAIRYNHSHRRWGHLFQNRYKSIVCDEREKVSIEELTSGSRRKEVSAIRGRIVPPGVKKYEIFPEPLQEIISPHFLLSWQLGK
jgi:hypothetical protein